MITTHVSRGSTQLATHIVVLHAVFPGVAFATLHGHRADRLVAVHVERLRLCAGFARRWEIQQQALAHSETADQQNSVYYGR